MPLLHPHLIDVISAAQKSGVSNQIRIVTNGLLLWKMTDAFWQSVNKVYVSIYPGKEMSTEQLELCKRQAQLYNVGLSLYYVDRFRESYAELGTNDPSLVNRIYKTCQIAHIWRCHTVYDGYFYKCPQSLFLPQVLKNDDLTPSTIDGIKIEDSLSFAQDLLAYLESPYPVASCKYCLGSVGKLFPHQQVSPQDWRQLQQKSTEQSIDMKYLTRLETIDPRSTNLCQRINLPR